MMANPRTSTCMHPYTPRRCAVPARAVKRSDTCGPHVATTVTTPPRRATPGPGSDLQRVPCSRGARRTTRAGSARRTAPGSGGRTPASGRGHGSAYTRDACQGGSWQRAALGKCTGTVLEPTRLTRCSRCSARPGQCLPAAHSPPSTSNKQVAHVCRAGPLLTDTHLGAPLVTGQPGGWVRPVSRWVRAVSTLQGLTRTAGQWLQLSCTVDETAFGMDLPMSCPSAPRYTPTHPPVAGRPARCAARPPVLARPAARLRAGVAGLPAALAAHVVLARNPAGRAAGRAGRAGGCVAWGGAAVAARQVAAALVPARHVALRAARQRLLGDRQGAVQPGGTIHMA